jgi:hypothetical protein
LRDRRKIFDNIFRKKICNFLKFMHFFIIFHYVFFNLTENYIKYNVAKYSQVTKVENIMYTIRVCNTITHLINT